MNLIVGWSVGAALDLSSKPIIEQSESTLHAWSNKIIQTQHISMNKSLQSVEGSLVIHCKLAPWSGKCDVITMPGPLTGQWACNRWPLAGGIGARKQGWKSTGYLSFQENQIKCLKKSNISVNLICMCNCISLQYH